jgi:hypothetical protein
MTISVTTSNNAHYDLLDNENEAVRMEIWWLSTERIWVLQELDANGNQVGNAMYEMNKRNVITYVEMEIANGYTLPITLYRNGFTVAKRWN